MFSFESWLELTEFRHARSLREHDLFSFDCWRVWSLIIIPAQARVRRGSVLRYLARGNKVGSATSSSGPPGKNQFSHSLPRGSSPRAIRYRLPKRRTRFSFFFPLSSRFTAMQALSSIVLEMVSIFSTELIEHGIQI